MQKLSRKHLKSAAEAVSHLALPPIATNKLKRSAKMADDRIVRLLERATFGYRESELDRATMLGFDGWLDEQIQWDSISDGGLDAALSDALVTLDYSYHQLIRNARSMSENAPINLIVATVLRQSLSPRQLYELMVEFWTNHFNVFLFDGPVQYLKTVDDRQNIRPHALGNFSDLLNANAASPAMLYYLDNYSNTASGPNENYARELMELHTLGVDGGYTEFDVKEVARCFTGWTINRRVPNLFYFDRLQHDFGEKRVLGQTIAAGGGIEDGYTVLKMLAESPATATFIATKLARRFVADDPPTSVIEAVAATFRNSNGDIPSVLRTLFGHEAFTDRAHVKFKRPAEYLLSVYRRTEAPAAGNPNLLITTLERLGQLPFFANPPTGYDDDRAAWLGTSTLLDRWNIASTTALGGRTESDVGRLSRASIASLTGGADTADSIVTELTSRIMHRTLGQAETSALRELAVQTAGSTATLGSNSQERVARNVLAALLISPAFQER